MTCQGSESGARSDSGEVSRSVEPRGDVFVLPRKLLGVDTNAGRFEVRQDRDQRPLEIVVKRREFFLFELALHFLSDAKHQTRLFGSVLRKLVAGQHKRSVVFLLFAFRVG